MSNIKISALTSSTTPLSGTEELPVVQSGTTKKATTQDVANLGKQSLQQVLDYNHQLSNGRNFQGTNAGLGNTGNNVNAFGNNAASTNSGGDVNALGQSAADSNTGYSLNALGLDAGGVNTGNQVNAFGTEAGYGNSFNNVNLFGNYASATNNNQTVLAGSSFQARIDYDTLTSDRLYNLPNKSGTIALTSDVPSVTLQQVLDTNHDLANGRNYQGTGAGSGNTGTSVNALGQTAAGINTGNLINALGYATAYGNTGSAVNAMGSSAASGNSGNHVNAFGEEAGQANGYSYVNLLGNGAQASANNQTVLAGQFFAARLGYDNLTNNRLYTFPDKNGTLALTNDIVVQRAVVSLTSAEILALSTTPKLLIAAQGTGTVIRVMDCSVSYTHNTVPYSNTQLRFTLGGVAVAANSALSLNSTGISFNDVPATDLTYAQSHNVGLYLTAVSNPTSGNGTIKVFVTYQVLTL